MEKRIKMKIRSLRYDVEASLFSILASECEDDMDIELFDEDFAEVGEEAIELATEGFMRIEGERVTLGYEESELTGMEGSSTSIFFELGDSGLVSMHRDGAVSTALVFERGKRHHCVYNTPIMPFEICVKTIKVENKILIEGTLILDYIIEIRGAKAERTKFEISVFELQEATVTNEASV
ncbi:MAG: DUF1934 domain-containing protein [Clostridia bacterium]|nr:DUF1934 domain-containing protein [Clostridia bacterium]